MARYIPDEIIEEIRNRADIVDVINSYVPLKNTGTNWQACCPFHQEKTPSFKVQPQRQTYHCFGCGKGGNVFNFIMEKEGVDFPEAARILAQKTGVIIPETDSGTLRSTQEVKSAENQRERLFLLHDKIKNWFEDTLWNNPASPVSEYLRQRQLPDDAIKKFGIGAAPDSWDAAQKWGIKEGFTEEELILAGILIDNKSTEQTRIYDRFRNRLIFPIWNEHGRVIAFSARTIEKNTEGAKYVNSPETPIFKKSKVLYALPFAKNPANKNGFMLLCEGQLDVIAMHRAGFENSVAPQGTAFTEEQARIIKRYTDKLYVAFDSDSAGIKATVRAFEIALAVGLQIKTVKFPEGKDPDEILRTKGPDPIKNAVETATDFSEFLFDFLTQKYDREDPSGKGSIVKEALQVFSKIENTVVRDSYTSQLAEKLELRDETVFEEAAKLDHQNSRSFSYKTLNKELPKATATAKTVTPAQVDESVKIAEETLLELALSHGTVAKRIDEELPPEMVSRTAVGKALEKIVQLTINGEWELAAESIAKSLTENPDSTLSRILASPSAFSHAQQEKAVTDCICRIKIFHTKKELTELKNKIAELPPDADNTNLYTAYQTKRKELLELERKNY